MYIFMYGKESEDQKLYSLGTGEALSYSPTLATTPELRFDAKYP